MWITVMFLSDVWILIPMASIHFRGSIGEQIQIYSKEKTNSGGWPRDEQFFIFGWTIALKRMYEISINCYNNIHSKIYKD